MKSYEDIASPEFVLQRSAKDVHHETDAGREFLLKASDAYGPLVIQVSPSTRDFLTVKRSQNESTWRPFQYF